MAHARVLKYKTTFGDGSSRLQQFSEVQARECGAMLESDGIAIHSAIRLVEKWNAMAILQGNKLRYSIPFVNIK